MNTKIVSLFLCLSATTIVGVEDIKSLQATIATHGQNLFKIVQDVSKSPAIQAINAEIIKIRNQALEELKRGEQREKIIKTSEEKIKKLMTQRKKRIVELRPVIKATEEKLTEAHKKLKPLMKKLEENKKPKRKTKK